MPCSSEMTSQNCIEKNHISMSVLEQKFISFWWQCTLYLSTDLVAALSGLKMNDFTHFDKIFKEKNQKEHFSQLLFVEMVAWVTVGGLFISTADLWGDGGGVGQSCLTGYAGLKWPCVFFYKLLFYMKCYLTKRWWEKWPQINWSLCSCYNFRDPLNQTQSEDGYAWPWDLEPNKSNMESLRPNRELLDPKFEGYKLSADPLNVSSTTLVSAVNDVKLKDELLISFQHTRAFGNLNHLVLDSWAAGTRENRSCLFCGWKLRSTKSYCQSKWGV